MPVSLTDLFNMALVKVGGDILTSPDDPSNNAIKLRAAWPIVLPAVLRAYPWNCAIRRATLPEVLPRPDWGPAYAYHWPEDCLRVLEVKGVPSQRGKYWAVEGRRIVTNLGPTVPIRYIGHLEVVGLMDASLVAALAASLAAEVCYPITGNATKAEAIRLEAEGLLRGGRSIDAQEGDTPLEVIADEWTGARA